MHSFWRKQTISQSDLNDRFLLEMIDRTHAVIHFAPDGTILDANENFLAALEYTLPEVVGKHHSIFVSPEMVASDAYKTFWHDISEGKFTSNQFPRVTKSKSIVWIQATYAPIFDTDGQVCGVIKVASDITQRRQAIERVAKALDALSNGNLGYRLKASGIADVDSINDAFNRASEQLSEMVNAMTEISADITEIVQQVSHASDDLSARTVGQAATLEQTAEAIEQITIAVRASSEGANAVLKESTRTREVAQNSEVVVAKSIDAMAQIEQSSSEISKIISVIGDIAFQTNLLALNAGVEAARAGDAGRGFAVVASEVRALAHRSQEAARDINSLISESSGHVANGVELVNQAGDELKRIIANVKSITDRVSTIANSTSEQATALNDINTSVTHLDAMTQKNAGMVENVTSANATLCQNVNQMNVQVQRFYSERGNHSARHSRSPQFRRAS